MHFNGMRALIFGGLFTVAGITLMLSAFFEIFLHP